MTADEQAMLIAALAGLPLFVNGGNLTNRQSAVSAIAEWANERERRLLGMGCGQALPRTRHTAWAESIAPRCKFIMRPGSKVGCVLLPFAQGMSAFGQDPKAVEGRSPASAVPKGCAQRNPSDD